MLANGYPEGAFQFYNLFYKAMIYCSVLLFISINLIVSIRNIHRALLLFFCVMVSISIILNWSFIAYVFIFIASYFLVQNIIQGYFSRSVVKVMIVLSLVFSFLQMLYFRSDDGRPALSFIDPNFSAFYVFMLFSVSYNLRVTVVTWLSFILGMFMLSRAFLLAVIVFVLIDHFLFFSKRQKN